MDSWYKFRNKKHKENLSKLSISSNICYGNYLIGKIAYDASKYKVKQSTIDKFFNTASKILQATVEQKGYENKELIEIYSYIDRVTNDVIKSTTTSQELGLMLGNLTELEEGKYTFTELIGFVRALASKIWFLLQFML